MLADLFWYVVIPIAALWLAYSFGWQRGYDNGFLVGRDEGIKEGKVAGEKIGIEKGVKERILNNLKGAKGGVLDETEMQIREKLYADLTKKPSVPAPAPPTPSYGVYWWTAASLAGALLVFWLI
ncbi:MAG: hypothetical protein E6Q83_10780 [Thiothrix sp.]|nr:MAG: hypothetical protein E6Q83_10780 [Thiothrix sp.]